MAEGLARTMKFCERDINKIYVLRWQEEVERRVKAEEKLNRERDLKERFGH